MALNIKDAETDRLARELAAVTGESITVAARRALQERLARVSARASAARDELDLGDLIARGRRRPLLDAQTDDAVLGYGGDGLPT